MIVTFAIAVGFLLFVARIVLMAFAALVALFALLLRGPSAVLGPDGQPT